MKLGETARAGHGQCSLSQVALIIDQQENERQTQGRKYD